MPAQEPFTIQFDCPFLARHPLHQQVQSILSASLAAVDPYRAVHNALRRDGDTLHAGGKPYDLSSYRRVFLAGIGKAGLPMAEAAAEVLAGHLHRGLLIVKDGYGGAFPPAAPIQVLLAAHPIPDGRSVSASREMAAFIESIGAGDLLVFLVSGGGSALLTLPVEPVTLGEIQSLTQSLLACGATIHEINTIRKHLDQLKGGRLAERADGADILVLTLSDVTGDDLEIIASGPTAPDPGTFADALAILERHNLLDIVPPRISTYLRNGVHGIVPETPKPGSPIFDRVHTILVGNNRLAAEAALDRARAMGWSTHLLTTTMEGEARDQGRWLAEVAAAVHRGEYPVQPPACLAAGGETTVTLRGDGLGGRNQELALAAVEPLAGLPGILLVTLATDGGDGPTDAAGAVVTGDTLTLAAQAGISPADYLARNDAYHFFDPLGALLRTGPTRTNVNDLAFLFVSPSQPGT